MLKTRLLHPGILEALGEAGHGAQVLIADGNYPLRTRSNDAARRVYLNLAPGLVSVTDVLGALVDAIPIEAARVMIPDDGDDPAIFADFRDAARRPSSSSASDGSRSTTRRVAPTSPWRSRRGSSGCTPTCCSRSAWYRPTDFPVVRRAVGAGHPQRVRERHPHGQHRYIRPVRRRMAKDRHPARGRRSTARRPRVAR